MSYLDLSGLTRFKQKLDVLFNGKLNTSLKGTPGGLAELDNEGKVPSSQLPSYVDDVLEYADSSAFPATGESGKIYVALNNNKTYRWSGTTYIEISQSLALGETESTAYRGDRGKTAYDHATDEGKVSSAITSGLYKVAVTGEGHIASASQVQKADITALGIPAQDTTYSVMTGATSLSDGESGLVPAPSSSASEKFLRGDGTWVQAGKPMVVLSYGTSTWSEFEAAYNDNIIVYCRASSNSDPASGSQTRMAFMAYVNNATTPTEVEFQYYRSVNSHSATQQGDQVFVYKLTKTSGWSVTTRQASSKIVAGTNMSVTYSSADTLTVASTLESKNAAVSGTDVSLVTTGEKAIWNGKADVADIPTATSDLTNDSGYLIMSDLTSKADLDANGKVPSSQLPSYVDDVVEYTSVSDFPAEGESSKIYVATNTNKTYRWSGSTYVEISASLALGETESTAYRGDRGATAYSHATDSNKVSSAVTSGLYKIAVTAQGHVASVASVAKSDITDLGIPGDISGKLDVSLKGAANGLAELGADGKVRSTQLPSSIEEYASLEYFPSAGETGSLYIAIDSNIIYRWDNTEEDYIPISSSSGGSTLAKTAFSILTTDWVFGSNVYTAEISNSNISVNSEEFVIYDSSLTNLTSNITTVKNTVTGRMVFTVATLPSGTISGTVYVLTSDSIDVDTKLNKNQGSENAGKFMKVGSDGMLTPETVPSPAGKADKVSNATAGNFAGLDANGNLTDSGSKASDFLTQHQDISGKLDKDQGSENAGKFMKVGTTGELEPDSVPNPQVMTGATNQTDGTSGLVPTPSAGDQDKVLKGDGTWGTAGLNPSDIANNLETTVAGKVLDARQGKTLDEKKIDKTYENPDDFTQKTWSGLASLPGCYIWTDGDNIYYSKDTYQYVLDKSTSTWNTKTWTWLTRFYGNYIWTDGTDIYYSNGTIQCVLNKSTLKWSNKTWTGMTDFDGNCIWTDGDNIYYSNSTTQVVLDKSTSTWSYKAWTGYTTVNGGGVWSDGDNIYWSNGSNQYVLDKSTSTWNTKTWTGLTNFSGAYIWSDGDNIYFSNNANQYVLNKSTSTWSAKTWTGFTNIIGDCIWTDGENIYHNTASSSHVYNKKRDYVLLGSNGEFNSITLDSFISMIEDKITSASGVSF